MADTSNEFTIQRDPHDRENPYVMVNVHLVRDQSLSPECRWMLIYLLSHASGFIIRSSHLMNHLKEFAGRDKVRTMMKEAIEAGYMKREAVLTTSGLKRYKYFVAESRKFKKCLPETCFQGPGNPAPENTSPLLSNINKEEVSISKKERSVCGEEGGVGEEPKVQNGSASPPHTQKNSPLFEFKKVKMHKERFDALVQLHGHDKVMEYVERLDEFSYINPKRFNQYAAHDVVIKTWIREEAKKEARFVTSKKSKPSLWHDIQKNLTVEERLGSGGVAVTQSAYDLLVSKGRDVRGLYVKS